MKLFLLIVESGIAPLPAEEFVSLLEEAFPGARSCKCEGHDREVLATFEWRRGEQVLCADLYGRDGNGDMIVGDGFVCDCAKLAAFWLRHWGLPISSFDPAYGDILVLRPGMEASEIQSEFESRWP